MLGASGAVLAFVGYSTYHYAQRHPERLFPKSEPTTSWGMQQIENAKFAYVVVGFPAILVWLVLAVVKIVETGIAADGSHLFGFLLGVVYVYLQPVIVGTN